VDILRIFPFQNVGREYLRQHRRNDSRRIGLRNDIAHGQRIAPVHGAFEQIHDVIEDVVEIAHLLGDLHVLDGRVLVGQRAAFAEIGWTALFRSKLVQPFDEFLDLMRERIVRAAIGRGKLARAESVQVVLRAWSSPGSYPQASK